MQTSPIPYSFGLKILIWVPGNGWPTLSSFAEGNSWNDALPDVSVRPYNPTTGMLIRAKNLLVD